MRFFRFILLATFLSVASLAQAQDDGEPTVRRGSKIIDDTTRQIYGPKTSKYFFEGDVFLNKKTYHLIDTAIRGFHRYNYVQKYLYRYQDLGNIGTSIRPLY